MKVSINKIEKIATDLALKHGGKTPPININRIAHYLGIDIHKDDLGTGVSGVLIIKNGKGVIGVNKGEADNNLRMRFTIAHELGHYMLHRFEQNLFIDQNTFKEKAVFHRDSESATGKQVQERQANAFAAAILMPKEMIIRELSKRTFTFDLADDDSDDDLINILAQRFEVSKQAMTFRLANLQII